MGKARKSVDGSLRELLGKVRIAHLAYKRAQERSEAKWQKYQDLKLELEQRIEEPRFGESQPKEF